MARDDPAQSRLHESPPSRRRFGRSLLGLLVATPRLAIAQAAKAVRRIGVLELSGPAALTSEFHRGQAEPLRELGWIEGQNLQVERRYADGRPEALQALAEELVRAKVEVIVTGGTRETLAAKRATTTVPIVFRVAADPVLVGLVASLARPGGNVTGYSDTTPETTTKQLSLLKELLPRLERIGVLLNQGGPYFRAFRGQFEHICQSLGLRPAFVEVAGGQIGSALTRLTHERVQALWVTSAHWDQRLEIIDFATKYGLPTMTDDSAWVREAGALLAYGTTWTEQCRKRAEYIDRILRGAKPVDLPVQQPTRFELAVNLKTARTLGLGIPKTLLLRADEVIQ